jgi:heme/copper-type cytochrome/quinol oxidase subunit 4
MSNTPNAGSPPVDSFKSYTRRCLTVFCIVVCVTAAMVATALAPIDSKSLSVALILIAATVNASLVAVHLMHLSSERGIIITVLLFTALFFVVLLGLTIWAKSDVPTVLH